MSKTDMETETNTEKQSLGSQNSQPTEQDSRDSGGEFQATSSRVQYGDSVTDVINRPDTAPVIKQTVSLFTAIGIGIGILTYFAVNSFADGSSLAAFGGALITIIAVVFGAVLGPVIASFTSIRALGFLSHLKDDLTYATGFVGAGAGQTVLLSITILLSTLPTSGEASLGFGDFTSVLVASVVVTAIVAVMSMYALKTLPDPQQPTQQPTN